MNKKFKFLTVLLALVMTLGAFAPFGAVKAADEATETESVTLHKILQTKENLKNEKFPGTKGLDDTEYIGKKIEETLKPNGTEKSSIASYFGAGSEDIGGVYFAWAKKDTDDKYYWIKNDGSFTEPKTEVKENELDKLPTDTFGGETVKDSGKTFTTTNFKGEYKIYEIHEKSSYKGNNGEALTDMKAVPVVITLPLVNNDGIVKDAHVYPKNTQDKPKIDKNFSEAEANKYMSETEKTNLKNAIAHKAAFEKAKKLYATTSQDYIDAEKAYTEDDKALIQKWGIDFEANTRGKQTLNKKIGDDVQYTVVTDIPAQTKWATAKWDDKMTEGLTYNKDLIVKLEKLNEEGQNKGEYTEVTLTKDTDYKVTETDNGFVLNFEKSGLDKLNNKAQSQKVTLTYSAKINNTTVADVEESNDVTFHYGNTPGKGNTPVPNKPDDNGELTITKNWDTGVTKQDVTFTLYNANTGKEVTKDDLVAPVAPVAPVKPKRDDYKDEEQYNKAKAQYDAELQLYDAYVTTYDANKTAFDKYKNIFENPVTIKNNNTMTYTWKYLNKNYEYKVIETFKEGYSVEYGKGALGQLTATNYKSDNPKPLNPSEPKVITGGKRFVKTNNENKDSAKLERLFGAEFYVKNAEGKYLVAAKKDAAAVTKAKKDLEDAVKAYNELSAEDQKGQKGTDAKKAIDTAQEAYNKVFKENAIAYTWGAKDDPNVVILTSDQQGRFEITGLEYGSYKLEEKTPPKDYAKLNGDVDFKVEKGSYDGSDTELKYNIEVRQGEKVVYGQQVKNKKVSIPETGGIGTVIFTVVGVMLMVGAAFALKRRKEDELEGLA